jgi:hypothetical protein
VAGRLMSGTVLEPYFKKPRALKLGDTDINFHAAFRLFLQTKLVNPHYPPEIHAECNTIYCTVTESGSGDQLFSLVVKLKRPCLARLKTALATLQNAVKLKLAEFEAPLLEKLSSADGDILEDVHLILALEHATTTSGEVRYKFVAAMDTKAKTNEKTDNYRHTARKGAPFLFFLQDYSFYKYSLEAFVVVVTCATSSVLLRKPKMEKKSYRWNIVCPEGSKGVVFSVVQNADEEWKRPASVLFDSEGAFWRNPKAQQQLAFRVMGSAEDYTAKVNVLLQGCSSRMRLEGFAMAAHMVYNRQSAGCSVRACEMPLRNFKAHPENVLRKIEKRDLARRKYYHLNAQELGTWVKLPNVEQILHRLIHQSLRFDMNAHAQPTGRGHLMVELTIAPDFMWDLKVHGSAEVFWVIVEGMNGENILHYKHFLRRATEFELQRAAAKFTVKITVPKPLHYFIGLVAYTWLSDMVCNEQSAGRIVFELFEFGAVWRSAATSGEK